MQLQITNKALDKPESNSDIIRILLHPYFVADRPTSCSLMIHKSFMICTNVFMK